MVKSLRQLKRERKIEMIKRSWIIMSFLGCMFLVVGTSNACPPIADIDCDATYNQGTGNYDTTVGVTVTFDGSDSEDSIGEGGIEVVAHKWTFPAEAYNISGENNVKAKCKFYTDSPTGYVYAVTLKVTDDEGLTDTETVYVKVTSALSSTWYVKSDGDDDNDGQSWENAFSSIQVGISSAAETETVIVEEGIYDESISFLGRDITVTSTIPDDPAVVANTIIDSVGHASAVTFEGSETSDCELTGFTIRDGGLKDYNPPSEGLVGHWQLDESSGTEASDSTINDNDGTLNYMQDSDWVPGIGCGNALDFDGIDDYVSIPDNDDYDVDGTLTVSHWFKTSTNQSGSGMVTRDSSSSGSFKYMTYLSGDSANLLFYIRQPSALVSVQTGNLGAGYWADDKWHHIAGVFDRNATDETKRLKLYIDGELVDTDPAYDEDIMDSDHGIDIGRWESGNEFKGTIDDVRIYNRALTAYEISEIVDLREPVGHWKLDETTGDEAGDSSDNNKTGDLQSMENEDWTAGKFGNALQFDGAGDEYVQITGYKGITGKKARTCAAWINTATTGDIISWGEYGIDGKWWLFYVDGTSVIRVSIGNGTIKGSTNVTSQWYHVTAVWDPDWGPDIDDVKLYVNGIEETTTVPASRAINTQSVEDVEIGVLDPAPSGNHRWFNGKIDDVRLYDRALTEGEIGQLYRGGGGVYGNDTGATISKCVVTENSALEGGGIAAFDGLISNCAITDNSAFYSGGGMSNKYTSSPTVIDCSFIANEAVYWGGGMENYISSSPTVTRCLFADNTVTASNYGGGAIYCYSNSNATITNCTISENSADNAYSGGLYSDSSDPIINSCIFWNNTDGDIDLDLTATSNSEIDVSYSDIYPDWYTDGTGNATFSYIIFGDPFFANPSGSDFHLKSVDGRWDPVTENWVATDTISSPCLAAGDSSVESNEPVPNGGRINMGIYGNTDYASKIQPYQVTINLVATDGEPLVDNPEWYIVYESGGYYYYDSVTRHSGDQVILAAGTYYAYCLDTETNCQAPAIQNSDFVVGSGQPSSYNMTYRAIGYLSVTLTPSTAQWRIVGSGIWHNSGDVVELTAFGSSSSYGVEFMPHLGYDTPSPIGGIFIYRGQQTNRNVSYPDLTRYVSYNFGNNLYDGKTPATAFRTIKYAIHQVDEDGGGLLYFAGEYYQETLQASDFNDLNYLTKCRTTAPSVSIAAPQSVFPSGNVNFIGPFYFDQ
jgi:hypothetical protein